MRRIRLEPLNVNRTRWRVIDVETNEELHDLTRVSFEIEAGRGPVIVRLESVAVLDAVEGELPAVVVKPKQGA